MILVAVSYANNFLNSRMAANEFSANKQFMRTTGLQIDDIAWTVGRTQTIRYSSQYGNVKFEAPALTYTFEVTNKTDNTGWNTLFAVDTGMILFNMPVSMYTMGNNYFERISSSNGSILQTGPSAPVTYVYEIEKLPMNEGNYTRIVAVPSVRMLNSSITGLQGSTNYYKFYLPALWRAESNGYLSQSVTLTGTDVMKQIKSGVNQVRITVTFPNGAPLFTTGYDSDFFKFANTSQTITLQSNSVVEFYVGKITVGLGQV